MRRRRKLESRDVIIHFDATMSNSAQPHLAPSERVYYIRLSQKTGPSADRFAQEKTQKLFVARSEQIGTPKQSVKMQIASVPHQPHTTEGGSVELHSYATDYTLEIHGIVVMRQPENGLTVEGRRRNGPRHSTNVRSVSWGDDNETNSGCSLLTLGTIFSERTDRQETKHIRFCSNPHARFCR
jgi:hypothetical protein